MAPPPNSAFAQVTLEFAGSGVPDGAFTTFGVAWDDDPQPVRDAVDTLWEDFLADSYSNDLALIRVAFKIGPSDLGPTYEFAGPGPGNSATESGPPNTAVLVKKTALGTTNRKGGRMYWPPVTEGAMISGGILAAGTQGNFDDGLLAMRNDLIAANMDPVVFHEDGSIPTPIAEFLCQRKLATQRRRLR